MLIQNYIDNTFLKPEKEEILKEKFEQTFKNNFRGLCIPLNYLDLALRAKKLFPSSTKIVIVDNFPMGKRDYFFYNFGGNIKGYRLDSFIKENFIEELDVVIPLFYLKQKGWNNGIVNWFLNHYYYLSLFSIKWIIEEPYWTWEEMYDIIEHIYKHWKTVGKKVPVFIKSNTGFVPRKRPLGEVVNRFIETVKEITNGEFGIKISGGVKTYLEAIQIAKLGGIIGTSSGLEILEEQNNEQTKS